MRRSITPIVAIAVMCHLWMSSSAWASLQIPSAPPDFDTSTEEPGTSIESPVLFAIFDRLSDIFGRADSNDADWPTTSPKYDIGTVRIPIAVQTREDGAEFVLFDDLAAETFIYFSIGQEPNDAYRTLPLLADLTKSVVNGNTPTACVSPDAQEEIDCDIKEVITVDGLLAAQYSVGDAETDVIDRQFWAYTGGAYFRWTFGYGFNFGRESASLSFPSAGGSDFDYDPIFSIDEEQSVGLGIEQTTVEPFPPVGGGFAGGGFGPTPSSIPETPTAAMILLGLTAAWFMIQRQKGTLAGKDPLRAIASPLP